MSLDPQQNLHLIDSQDRCLGKVLIDRIQGNRVFAQFIAGPEIAAAGELFRGLEEAVNDQLFQEADRLSREIDTLGLRVASDDRSDSLVIIDVQIMNGTDFSCRVPNLGLTQGRRATANAEV